MEMYLIEETIQNTMGGGYDDTDEIKILVDEGLFTSEAAAKARCVALAREEFDKATDEFKPELAELGYDGPEIEISILGSDGGTCSVIWNDISHSWRVVPIKVN